eukprot:5961568-Alexandrium_andersonii.AAC.1
MLDQSVQLGLSRHTGRATMAESPRGQGRTPSTEAHRGPRRVAAKRAPYCGRRCFCRAAWRAAKRRPKALCHSALARTAAPIRGRLWSGP